MKNRLTNAGVLGNAHIKTGTLRDVRAIAGYVAGADGSYIVVSFINNDHAEAARAHDSLLEWIYAGALTVPRAATRRAHGRCRRASTRLGIGSAPRSGSP